MTIRLEHGTAEVKESHAKKEHLFPQLLLVKGQLVTLKNVPITPSALARSGGDNSVETTGSELSLQWTLNLGGSLPGSYLPLDLPGLLGLLGTLLLLLFLRLLCRTPLLAQRKAVVGLIPLPEGSGIDLDDGGLGQGVCTDQLVV